MFLGQLLHKIQKKSYYKLSVGVETGYNVDLYTIRVRNYLNVNDLRIGDQVLFSGQYVSKKNIRQFQLHFITIHPFRQCSECHIPLTSNVCFIKHDKEAQKLNGEWGVIHKIQRDGNVKVFFERDHFVFAAVATPTHWYYQLFRRLKDKDNVIIEGWRYKQKTSIKVISMNNTYENMQKQESDYEVIENLQKTFTKTISMDITYENMQKPESHYEAMENLHQESERE